MRKWVGDVVMMPWTNNEMLLEGRTTNGDSYSITMTVEQQDQVHALVDKQMAELQNLLISILEEGIDNGQR